ncbi:hypothetical protein [Streptomyces longwoodensis]|uniref:hypothetical protein n=1 Tax=Streptomyces longwoodensis TaxID=68231 RepID=UPI0036E328D0
MTDPLPLRHEDEARRAGELVEAWSLVRMFVAREPALADALTAIDTTDLAGPLDRSAIELALSEARADLDRTAALAELERRRRAAGVGSDARCTACGHNSTAHAHRMKSGRLPCPASGCGCRDLVLVVGD